MSLFSTHYLFNISGNAAIGKNLNDTFLSNYRTGILIHTGEWKDWKPNMNMPNR